MIRPTSSRLFVSNLFTILTLCISAPLCQAEPASSLEDEETKDMLRFNNGDTLHGTFLGFGNDQTMIWKNPEAEAPIKFSTKKSHRIILNRGLAHQSVKQKSTVTLINGDIIPGRIQSANDETIQLDTEHLGMLNIPRDTVSSIAPTPYGGKLLYYGPLSPDGWKTIAPTKTKKEEKAEKEEDKEQKIEKEKKDTEKKEELTDWKHIAGAWYAGTDKYRYLVRENALPDKCRLAFKMAWRGSLYCNIGLHADFSPPPYEGEEDIRNNMAATVGRAYVVTISAHSAMLYTCSFDENGKPLSTRISDRHVSMSLSGKDEADVEFRIDRPNKQLLFYLDGQFKTKWDLGENYDGKGNGLAFRNLRYSSSELRISDIVISQWNGLKDSAQSMKTKERDIILLTNGVDRFSGKFNQFKNNAITFEGTYKNRLVIPANEVQEIHFGSKKLRQLPEDRDDQSVYFYVAPYGRISGTPSIGVNGKTKLLSELLGAITLDTRYVNIIDFSHQNSLLDIWDDNF
ncbi:MAG: hypothetical protein KJO79_02590 [Verrucomicrobiae bacterium]|nr:hypothetical protein [Verrucomicrobiae bacterium]NNJ86042.1 hypothetical protein [Akkermansiaceae bacterium]